MKKIFAIVVSLLLVTALLCGCSSKEVDLKQVFDDINAQYGISDLKVIEEADKLDRYYQIDAASVKQYAAGFSTESSVFTEVVLIEAVDEDSAKDIATSLNNHYQARLSEGKSYSPESVEMLEKCKVRQNGTYVDLVIADNAEDITKTIDSYFE